MTKTTATLGFLLVAVAALCYVAWTMQGQLVTAHEALFDLQQIERARKSKRKLPT